MERYIKKLREFATTVDSDRIDGMSIMLMLYDCYTESIGFDNLQIKRDFDELYQRMHNKSLKEIDEIIYAVCTLCRDHEFSGFTEGMKVGLRLSEELNKK